MEKENAINVLLQVANLAQAKGILSLEDAEIVLAAVRLLTPKKEENEQTEE
jgi:hypothetical protein